MQYLYIIHSPSADNYYVGITTHPEQRLSEHNSSPRSSSTSPYRPWHLVALFECGPGSWTSAPLGKVHQKAKVKIDIIH